MDEEAKFKVKYKNRACSAAPFEFLIPTKDRKAIMLQIKNESIDAYGEDLTGPCNNLAVCFQKTCIGRKLPYLSPTALPYIKMLESTHKVVNEELFIENCESCPIAATCKSPCYQVNNYLSRHNTLEPVLNYKHTIDNYEVIEEVDNSNTFDKTLGISWDCINELNKKIISDYIYGQRDFEVVAKANGLKTASQAKYRFYNSLNKLSEYSIMRKFLSEGEGKMTYTQLRLLQLVYLDNKSITEAAKDLSVTKQGASQLIKRVIKNNKIKFQVFVKKHNNKLIYSVPAIFKE